MKMMRNVNELVNDVEVSEPLKKLEVLIASVKYHLVQMFISKKEMIPSMTKSTI